MTLAAYLGIASGLALVLTGIGMGTARPRRLAGWFFAAFVLVWGVEIVLFNSFGLVQDLSTILFLERTAFAFVLVEVLLLVHFTVRFTGGLESRVAWWSWGAAGFVLVTGLFLAVDPTLFSEPAGPTFFATALVVLPFFLAVYVTLGIMAARHRDELYETEHREVRIVLAGLLLYAAYTTGFYLSNYGLRWVIAPGESTLSGRLFAVVFALATTGLLLLALTYHRMDDVPSTWGTHERPLLTGLILGLLALGLATGTPRFWGPPRVDLFGLLRIGSAAVIAYGLLKFEIFDIDRKVKLAIQRSLILGAFLLVFLVVSEGIEILVSDAAGTWAGLGAAGLLTFTLKPLERGAEEVANRVMPGVDESPAYREKRKQEIYQAALERVLGDEVLTDRERSMLTGLQQELGLDAEKARSIEARLGAPVARS